MRVLWIVNVPLPDVCKSHSIKGIYGGGWMQSLLEAILDETNIDMAVATPFQCENVLIEEHNNVRYYLVPGGEKSKHKVRECFNKEWKNVIDDFKPDIIHCHGSEYAHTLTILKNKGLIPAMVSIQGLVGPYAEEYYAGISVKDIIANYTLKDLIRKTGIFACKKEMEKRGKVERDIIANCDMIVGRTQWDKSHAFEMNHNAQYRTNNESLRKEFYECEKWSIDKKENNAIFISQATYPIKGFHKLIEAVAILKQKNIECSVKVAGSNIFGNNIKSLTSKIKDTGYSKYVKKLIERYGLEDKIEFLGTLNAQQVATQLQKSHVFVVPSSIENSPNSLGEAMIIGVPSIASYVGGVPSIVTDDECILYPFNDAAMLAKAIYDVFTNDDIALKLSSNAKKRALKTHDKPKNLADLLKIYEELALLKK